MAKVLIFYQYYCTPKGSWGTRYYEFTRRWAAAGHDVTVVTSIYDKSDLVPRGFVTRFDIEGVRVIAMNLVLSNKHGVLRRSFGQPPHSVPTLSRRSRRSPRQSARSALPTRRCSQHEIRSRNW